MVVVVCAKLEEKFDHRPNLTAIGWGKKQPFGRCYSLLRIDLSGFPKLESIPVLAFSCCEHLVSVVFGKHSNITNIGANAFQRCFALTSITLPDKLKVLEKMVFANCTSLERVVCNKNLKTIGIAVFQYCPELEDVQLASSSISFGRDPFAGCDRLIELAAAAGFPSPKFNGNNYGDGIVLYLLARFERSERKRYVLLAHMRFKNAFHASSGTEEEKVTAAKKHHPRPPSMPHPTCFTCKAKRRPTRTLRYSVRRNSCVRRGVLTRNR